MPSRLHLDCLLYTTILAITSLLSTRSVRAFVLVSSKSQSPLFSFSQRQRQAFSSSRLFASAGSASASSSSSSTSPTMTSTSATPPVPRRDENAHILAGIAPDPTSKLPRQSDASTEPLLDPPVPVPDVYGWMRHEARTDPDVLQHLAAENAYTQAMTQHLTGGITTSDSDADKDNNKDNDALVPRLYNEMLSRIQETDHTTPRPHKDHVYYSRTLQGKAYTVHCRAPLLDNSNYLWTPDMDDAQKAATPVLQGEQIILDVNQLAEGQSYCSTGSVKISPSHTLLAYAVDFSGDETCELAIREVESGTIVHQDPDLTIYGSLQWGATDETLFYLVQDAAQRPYRVYKRTLVQDGTNEKNGTSNALKAAQADELLFEELDDMNWLGFYKSKDGQYLFIETSSKETTEIYFLDLHDPDATLKCVAPKRPKVLYEVEHYQGNWWISSNVGGLPNMALWSSPAVADCADQWTLVRDGATGTVLFDGSPTKSLDAVVAFRKHACVQGREGGLPRVWILGNLTIQGGDESEKTTLTVGSCERLEFAEDAYDCGLGTNFEYETDNVVVVYDSMVTPPSSIEINMSNTSERKVLKEKTVPGYNKELYACERTTVLSRDGEAQIPVSLVYRKDVMEQHVSSQQPVPLHLYGYGSYGACMEADFVASRLPLLDRGMVYVIAHVRGGGEMGRIWYEEPNGAKYLCKKNTFNDFIDVAKWLIEDRKLTSPEVVSCEGRSAGGLLIGASINQAPELFKVAVLGVPFVDVVATMIDASIPLTAVEWEEWGNPNEVKYHQYMMDYNPVTNVKNAKYPACLLTGGLHDPRVQYWEPAKLAAELRHSQAPESGPVCLKIDMSAGHFSASDRYKYLKEKAFDYAFLLDQVGLADKEKLM